jgi:hypothetical protein
VSTGERLRLAGRYAVDLPRFLRSPVTTAEARQRITDALAHRTESFLEVLERGVYASEASPYRRLLAHAGIEFGDIAHLVEQDGIEGTLERLLDAGVHVSLEEFKGRRPIVRAGLELAVAPEDFDNPLATTHLERLTGGSRGLGRHVSTDLRLITHEASYQRLLLDSLGLAGRPMAIWSGQPSGSARVAFRQLKAGESVDRWMAKTPEPASRRRLISEHRLRYAVAVSRLVGAGTLASPEFVSAAVDVAQWVAAQTAAGRPAFFETPASTGVQVCIAADDHDLDISGTWFRFAGEPYTRAKAAVVARAGAHAVCHYSVSEVGRVACACTTPAALDDVHVLTEKLAVLQRPRLLEGGKTVRALHLSTLMAICPKLMLNVEVDDYAVLERRSCSCPLGELGLDTHLREIRSYEKLTGKGINFLGDDLVALVDETLPMRFGGAPTDYQLVEQEVNGLPRLGVVVSPRVGAIDEEALVEVVLATVETNPSNRGMVATWRQDRTLRVLRREPYETSSAKLLPLHIAPPTGTAVTAHEDGGAEQRPS